SPGGVPRLLGGTAALRRVDAARRAALGLSSPWRSPPACEGGLAPSGLVVPCGLPVGRVPRTPQREGVSMTPEPAVFNAKIRNRILVRILVAASLVLVGMGLVLYLLTRQLLHAEITAKSEAMVSVGAAAMERWLVEKRAALAALADVEAQYTAPHPAQRASFTLVGQQIGEPPGVYMGYEDGPFVSTKTGGDLPADYDHHQRPWYQEAVAQDHLIFTAPYVDARTQRLILRLAAPGKKTT